MRQLTGTDAMVAACGDTMSDAAGAAGLAGGEGAGQPGPRWNSGSKCAAIRAVGHFKDSEYRALGLNALESYIQDFVEPLLRTVGSPCSVADVGARYGWLSLAFALRTGATAFVIQISDRPGLTSPTTKRKVIVGN